MSTPTNIGFEIGQRVNLVEAGIQGVVQQVLFNADGVQYQVRYWVDASRRVEWMFASELAAVAKVSKIVP